MTRVFFTLFLSLIFLYAHGKAAFTPLPPDKAFVFSTYFSANHQLILEWNIAPGYYLYRDQLHVTFSPANPTHLTLPTGQIQQDTLHGTYQAYSGRLKIPVSLPASISQLKVNYQGCSHAGFCYAPIKKIFSVDSVHQYTQPVIPSAAYAAAAPTSTTTLADLFTHTSFFMAILSFLGLGLLLAFTPCVLPMVPILSGIIVGQSKHPNKKRAFLLSLAYVSGMAITYAMVGVAVALIGGNIQAQLQQPWIIILFSGLFVLLALSLFGLYELQLPAKWQRLIVTLSNQQKGGTYVGVFLMGCLSTLIVSPCVSAPLVGVLAYIGQTGNVLFGGTALLALGIGMGLPLLLIGISADKILPKAGPWMLLIERIFGIVMLGLAIWMLSRMLPGPVTLFLWSILCLFSAIFVGFYFQVARTWRWLVRSVSILVFVYGVVLLVGVAMGNADPFYPWEQLKPPSTHPFMTVRSLPELEHQLAIAKQQQQPVLLDFYADWCVACVVMDKSVFSQPTVQTALSSFMLLHADLTKNTAAERELLAYFHLFGPPTVLFFDSSGRELTAQRIVGEVNAKEFLAKLKEI